ncbi:MAG: hypothetical protein HFH93_14730 [Lachnospiraceae bacterium]|nr:hypothetical protein [Lachnospiraceae bacterium]
MIEDSGRTGGKSGRRGTAFYIEALVLVGVFTVVVLILTRVFVLSGRLGKDAALLTDAVHLAENGAEAVAASDSLEEVRRLLEEAGNGEILPWAQEAESQARILRLHYDRDMNPEPGGGIWMDIRWIPEAPGEESGGTGLVKSVITVHDAGLTEPVYTLETEVFIGHESANPGADRQ